MGELAVTVRLRGRVVEDRVLPVRDQVRLGERFDASVGFPGADLLVVRDGEALLVRGQRLAEGEDLRLSLGAVDVRLCHVASVPLPAEGAGRFDLRFLLAVLLVAALGTWLEAASRWAERQLPAEGGLQSWIERVQAGPPDPARSAAR